jgi:hypothetical protein
MSIPGERRRSALEFVTIGLLVASLLLLFIVFQRTTEQARIATSSNRALIREVRRDLGIHAVASADRTCAIAKEIRYVVVALSPTGQPAAVLEALDRFVEQACKVVIPGRLGPGLPGGDGTSSESSSPPGVTPGPPSSTNTPPPNTTTTPPPTPSPSPSPTCIPGTDICL